MTNAEKSRIERDYGVRLDSQPDDDPLSREMRRQFRERIEMKLVTDSAGHVGRAFAADASGRAMRFDAAEQRFDEQDEAARRADARIRAQWDPKAPRPRADSQSESAGLNEVRARNAWKPVR
jgi:hypothetical protein